MKLWYIYCMLTGSIWSRNGWAKNGATPDLYKTEKRAIRQCEHGKAKDLGWYTQTSPGEFKEVKHQPAVARAKLILY